MASSEFFPIKLISEEICSPRDRSICPPFPEKSLCFLDREVGFSSASERSLTFTFIRIIPHMINRSPEASIRELTLPRSPLSLTSTSVPGRSCSGFRIFREVFVRFFPAEVFFCAPVPPFLAEMASFSLVLVRSNALKPSPPPFRISLMAAFAVSFASSKMRAASSFASRSRSSAVSSNCLVCFSSFSFSASVSCL